MIKLNTVHDFQCYSMGGRLTFELLVDAWAISKELVDDGPKKYVEFSEYDKWRLAMDLYDYYSK